MEYCSSDDSDIELFQMILDCDEDSDSDTNILEKQYKPRVNYMSKLNEYEFSYRFRLNKSAVNQLLVLIQPLLVVTSKRNHGISPLHQILLALRYYALGTMLVSVADFIGVSIASASRIVSNVSRAIAKLYPKFIILQSHTQQEFYNIAGFPRVHGALDGTHILIQSPNSNVGEEFRNRKGQFSINVQVVCNASLLFQNVVARWPGSTHDATIFNQSDLKEFCEQGGLGNRWLLGDSGYPCKKYLLTPLLNPETPSEQRYNEAQIKTRNTIERCIGVWKRRFPVLSLKCRLKLENVQAVIIATAVLHNIARENVTIIGSDDATSCIIVVLRHSGSGAVALAHLDGSGTAEAAAAMVAKVQQLAVGYPEGRLELQIIGGFTDPHRYSDELFANIMLSFHRLSEEIDLTLACCCELNTALGGGPAPLVLGVGVDVRAGDLFPATFPDKGPELPLRCARTITGGPNSAQVLDIYDNAVGMLRIGPFNYDPLRGVDLWLEQSDEFILQHLSTTPNVEPPHFVHNIRVTLKFIQQHPFPAVTVFPDNRPHYYRRDDQSGCWLPVRF